MNGATTCVMNQVEGKIWYGGDWTFPECQNNLGQYLLDAMLKNHDSIAQIDPVQNISFTHRQMRLLSVRCALNMREQGLKSGDVVVVCARNHLLAPIPILAAMYLGLPVNILHPTHTISQIQHLLKLVRPSMIICDADVETKLKNLMEELGLTVIVNTFEDDFFTKDIYSRPIRIEREFVAEKIDPSQSTAFIFATSGSVGPMKGVDITHSAMYNKLVHPGCWARDADVMIAYAPLCWISGLWVLFFALFNGGHKLACEYESNLNIEILKKLKGEFIFGSPVMMMDLISNPEFIKHPEIAVQTKRIGMGGAISTKQQLQNYRRIFKNADVFNLYGTTEMNFVHAEWIPSDCGLNIQKINSIGKVRMGCYWKIRDIETGKLLGNNQIGELLIKGPTMMRGYYNDPEATAKAIDEEGFFHTGDLVIVDDDDCLFHMGRCNELLKYNHHNIIPGQLEVVLLSHADILEACVVVKPDPEMMGDLATAMVVKKPSSKLTEVELLRIVNDELPDAEKIRGGLHFIKKFPKSPAGKILRQLVQDMAAEL